MTRKIKQLEVEGARAPVPHGWRRQCWNMPKTGHVGYVRMSGMLPRFPQRGTMEQILV